MKIHTQTNKEDDKIYLEFQNDMDDDFNYFQFNVWMSPKICEKLIIKLKKEIAVCREKET